jgi:hypothetical protein
MFLKNKNESFLGEFLNDEYDKGTFYFNNGDTYKGEFKNN